MLNQGDTFRTFVVRAQLLPLSVVSSSPLASVPPVADGQGGETAADKENDHTRSHAGAPLPACAPATPGDVEERGVVVGHFQNRVTEGVVGTALRLELAVELSEEGAREARSSSPTGRRRFRLAYEVAADPADWAVSGVTKGTVEVGVEEDGAGDGSGGNNTVEKSQVATMECKLVPVRVGLLACPALTFEPVDVRPAVSPKSRKSSNVRWVGPRDIQILGHGGGLKRIPTVRIQK